MPLLDHFNPPLSQRRRWESFHSGWAEALAQQLNAGLLPPRYVAEVQVTVGNRVEIDVGTFEEKNGVPHAAEGDVAIWAPPRPTAMVTLPYAPPDSFEIQITSDEEGPKIVAAMELVSPANKDRPANRHAFAIKCASYIQQNISVAIIDVVTPRKANLHRALLDLLEVHIATPCQAPEDLYAAAYRCTSQADHFELSMWVEKLSVGGQLPIIPLWISASLCVPVDLEQAYLAACTARRIG